MALSRRLGVVAILSSCFFVAVACGDDDSKKATGGGDAGAGGEGGDDGSGSGGSKNTAGKGGMSTAGTAGQGTAGSGGTAGTGGNISESGSGGGGDEPMAGAGGDGGTGPGVGGEGGVGAVTSGGAGGEGGAPVVVLRACAAECETDGDCAVLPDNTDYKCNLETKTCENPAESCDADDDCVKNQWLFDCDGSAPCPWEGDVCISWQGQGWCATPPELQSGCIFGGAPEILPFFGQTGTAEVCVDRSWICGDKKCEIGCAEGLGCGMGKGDSCNEATHRCECELGTECESGVCGDGDKCTECTTDEHCEDTAGATGHDICVDGKCGCSGSDKCLDKHFVGATTVCE